MQMKKMFEKIWSDLKKAIKDVDFRLLFRVHYAITIMKQNCNVGTFADREILKNYLNPMEREFNGYINSIVEDKLDPQKYTVSELEAELKRIKRM